MIDFMKHAPLKADEILHEFRNSSSLPVLVKAGDHSHVVKWKGGGDGHIAGMVDWIALHMARRIGVDAPRPVLIDVGPDLRDKTRDAEIRDLIDGSQGLNLGVRYLADAISYNPDIHGQSEQGCESAIFFFDLLMLNIDRIDVNPNMLVVNNRLYCIDFSTSMALRSCITGERYNEKPLLQRLKRHPFYTLTPSADFKPDEAFHTHIREIIEEAPAEWMQCPSHEVDQRKQALFDNIKKLLKDAPAIIQRRLEILAPMQAPTHAEDRSRSLKNRRISEARFSRSSG